MLLERLGLEFEIARPDIDESAHEHETAEALAKRLAEAKARCIALRMPEAWVIGSDQVAELDGALLGKPGSFERAADQLSAASGSTVHFHTAVSVQRMADRTGCTFCDLTTVQFRQLGSAEIERYLHAEQPYDCAGSFKSEGLGITLFERIDSTDPTALVGLPLIELSKALRRFGFKAP